jgi:filamentous hemagglutinin family protein
MKHSSTHANRFALQPLALAIAAALTPLAIATPQGGQVTAGQAAIAQKGNATTVTQGSQRAAIDWRSFNVGANESVNFVQPNASASILNRVTGNDASAIFGRITANGQVLLVNPNGILFGRGAQVDVGSLVATTSNISNANFMAGKLLFDQPDQPGATVRNEGSITVAEGGFAALVGRGVENSGVITARLGKVTLAGGDAFVLDLYGDKLVNLVVDPDAMGTLADANGVSLATHVDHSGQILADGGRVQLTAATVKRLIDNLINVSGVVRATSFSSSPGLISLTGDANTRVAVSGTLDTSGNTRGGRIEVTGRDVALQSGALLAAVGGAGSIAVGGDWQGGGSLAHAQQVNVESGARIDAGGGQAGHGGTVALWSDAHTQFNGAISASGGAASGSGGQVEVSSKGSIGFQGDVDVFATHGAQGSLLLDPTDLRIGTVSSGDSEISADQLRFFLIRGAGVTLSADRDVTVDAEINGLVSGALGTAGGGLSLTAGRNLQVNHTIALNDGALNLTAAGTLTSAAGTTLYTGNGAVTLRGAAGVDMAQVVSGGAVDIRSASGTVNVRGALVSASSTGAAAPVGSLNVQAAGNVDLNGALSSGNIAVNSAGGNVALHTAALQSTGGTVNVQAGQGIASDGAGVGLVSAGNLTATAGQGIDLSAVLGAGQIALNAGGSLTVGQAIGNVGGGAANGLAIQAGNTVSLAGVRTGTGGIAITTTAGNVTSSGTNSALVSSGAVAVTAAGSAGTNAARLNVDAGAGNINLQGAQGVNAASLYSTGSVTLAASSGGVDVSQAISGAAGAVSASTAARPSSVAITARDNITLNGAAVGAGGLTVDSSAGSVTASTASLFSQGAVGIAGQGAVTLDSGMAIDTQGNASTITLTSRNAALNIGSGGVRANGDAAVTLNARNDVTLNGDVQTHAGTITITSSNGSVAALTGSSPAASDAVIDAGQNATTSRIVVNGASGVRLGEMHAYADITAGSSSGNVVLGRGLGGSVATTGYGNFAQGYQDALRPDVGRLVIAAPAGSVELNGLNLDGNRLPTDTTPGLSVTAGHMIVSNAQIAVNKGDVVLASTGVGATDGVYLGNNVYSRGWDSVGADGTRGTSDDRKTAYAIQISGNVLGLFDKTDEIANVQSGTSQVKLPDNSLVRVDAQGYLVDINGQRTSPLRLAGTLDPNSGVVTVYDMNGNGTINSTDPAINGQTPFAVRGSTLETRDIAKIIVSNNTANYQDANDAGLRERLVPYTVDDTSANTITVNAQSIAGVLNTPAADGLHLGSFTPSLGAMSQAPVSVAARSGVLASTQGIALKALGFAEANDQNTLVWNTQVSLAKSFEGFFADNNGTPNSPALNKSSQLLSSEVPVAGVFSHTVTDGEAYREYQVITTPGGQPQTRAETIPLSGGSTTYTFAFHQGSSSPTAEVTGITLSGVSLPANNTSPTLNAGETLVSTGNWQAGRATAKIGSVADVRFSGTSQVLHEGQASDVRIAGALYPATTAGEVQSGTGTTHPLLTTVTDPAQLLQTTFNLQSADPNPTSPIDFTLKRVTVDSSTDGSYSTTTAGTRVLVYDGTIASLSGVGKSDLAGGALVPGVGGIQGSNNSATGFAGIGTSFTPAGGTGTTVTAGTGTSTGVGGVTIPAAGNGGLGTIDDRTTQDVGTDNNPSGNGLDPSTNVAIGLRPASLADFGRGGGVQGSVANVFAKLFRVATSTSPSVCAPEALQTADGARDCKPK